MNELVLRALRELLATPVARLLATYESDEELKNDDIIRLYVKLTGKRPKKEDFDCYAAVKHLHPHVLKIGMLLTVLQHTGDGVNSFKYMLPEIEKAKLTVPNIQSPEEYVKYLLSKIKRRKTTPSIDNR